MAETQVKLTCPRCGGTGIEPVGRLDKDGKPTVEKCWDCHGWGYIVR